MRSLVASLGVLTVVGTVAFDVMGRVSALPAPEETAGVVELDMDVPGGTAGNVSMALARLGAPPRLLSCVGPDFAGSAYERQLASAGLDLSLVRVVEAPTSRAFIFFDGAGKQMTFFHAGASRDLADAWPTPPPLGRAHFAAGEISCYPRLMQSAEWVSFDPGQEVFHRELEQLTACLPHVDLLFLNRHERDVLESRAGWSLERMLSEGVSVIVETRGAGGSVVHSAAGRFAAPAVEAVARDPTGAGDAHRAGFLYALERGAELGVCARFASVLGAFAVETVGAQGHPTLDEAVARYQKAFGEPPF